MGRTWDGEVLGALHQSSANRNVSHICELNFLVAMLRKSKKKQVGTVLWNDDLAVSYETKHANTI